MALPGETRVGDKLLGGAGNDRQPGIAFDHSSHRAGVSSEWMTTHAAVRRLDLVRGREDDEFPFIHERGRVQPDCAILRTPQLRLTEEEPKKKGARGPKG